MSTQELQVKIESEGGTLTLTPMGLLQHFLPGAQPMPGNSRVFVGHPPGKPHDTVYVNIEALAGMLMEAREKHINVLSGMYLIPSNLPDKPASHKIKYDVRIERARKIPGFLGQNMGLMVTRKGSDEVIDRQGEVPFPGDTIFGAWAEVYIQGLPRPLRKEVPASVKTGGDSWNKHMGFMYCKVAIDRLLRLNFPSLYANETALPEDAPTESDITLEATAPGQWQAPSPQTKEEPPAAPYDFQPETSYVGEIIKLTPRETKEMPDGKKRNVPGVITLQTEHGALTAFFWERPESLKAVEHWKSLIGKPGNLVFFVKEDRTGVKFRYVQDFQFADGSEPSTPEPAEEAA